MFCKKCGNEVNEKNNYCPNCGEPNKAMIGAYKFNIEEEKAMFCKECGNQQTEGQYCKNCGAKLGKAKWKDQSAFPSVGNIMQGLSADRLQGCIKEKCAQYKDTNIMDAIKHGAVFSTCMTMLTLLFILIVQKVVIMLPIFQNSFWLKNSGARDVKSYILAAMYGLKVNMEGKIGINLDNVIKLPSLLILITLLFVAISFFIAKKVSGRSTNCNLLELAVFSAVNSVFAFVCALIIKENVLLKASETAQMYGDFKFSLLTGIPIGNCLCTVFLVTLFLLVLANGIKLKQNEKNSTLLYALRSNMAFIGTVLLSGILLSIVIYAKTNTEEMKVAYMIVMLGGGAFQILYTMATNFATGMIMSMDGISIFDFSMNFTNLKVGSMGITIAEIQTSWLFGLFLVLVIFIAVRVVYDVLKMLKHINTNDTRTSLIELVKYSTGYSLITAFVLYIQNMCFSMTVDVANSSEYFNTIAPLDGRTVALTYGSGSVVAAFFKVFFVVFLISILTFFVSKNYESIIDKYVVANKNLIKRVSIILVCVPVLCVWFVSEEKLGNSLAELGTDDKNIEQSEARYTKIETKWKQNGIDENAINAVLGVEDVLKNMLAN